MGLLSARDIGAIGRSRSETPKGLGDGGQVAKGEVKVGGSEAVAFRREIHGDGMVPPEA